MFFIIIIYCIDSYSFLRHFYNSRTLSTKIDKTRICQSWTVDGTFSCLGEWVRWVEGRNVEDYNQAILKIHTGTSITRQRQDICSKGGGKSQLFTHSTSVIDLGPEVTGPHADTRRTEDSNYLPSVHTHEGERLVSWTLFYKGSTRTTIRLPPYRFSE